MFEVIQKERPITTEKEQAYKVSNTIPNKRGPPPYSMLTPLPQYADDTVFRLIKAELGDEIERVDQSYKNMKKRSKDSNGVQKKKTYALGGLI